MTVRRLAALAGVVVCELCSAQLASAQMRAPGTLRTAAPTPAPTTAPAAASTPSVAQAPRPLTQNTLVPTTAGISVTYANAAQGTAFFSLGTATNFQFQFQPNGGASRFAPEWSGSIQFTPTNQQALQVNTCAVNHCTWTVQVSNVTAQGTITYTLYNVRFTNSGMGAGGLSTSFTFEALRWAPRTAATVQALGVNQGTAPPGVTAMTGAGQYLGPVVNYQVEDVPTGQNSHARQATGTLQLPVSPQALDVLSGENQLVITTATAQGRSVYTLGTVWLSSVTLGSTVVTINVGFTYRTVQYATYTGTSTVPTQNAGWNYLTGQPIQ